jgi:hypothetical protein
MIHIFQELFGQTLRSGRKQPDQNGGGLQNHFRKINGLAQNPIGYRYTIPQYLIIFKYLRDILRVLATV